MSQFGLESATRLHEPESLVIVDQPCYGDTFPGLVLTARHTMGVDFTRSRNTKLVTVHSGISDWGEVVTR